MSIGRALLAYTFWSLLFLSKETTHGAFFNLLCIILDPLGTVVIAGKIQVHLNASLFLVDIRPSSLSLTTPTYNRGQGCYCRCDYTIHDVIIIDLRLGLLVDGASMIAKIFELVS
jgi:hypothetical protein